MTLYSAAMQNILPMNIKPLLATAVTDFDAIKFPVLASPKLDGIRCLTIPNANPQYKCQAVSRNLKPIPNSYVRDFIEENLVPGFDGELMVVDENGKPLPFNEVSSGIMSRSGTPHFQYWVFDFVGDSVDGAFGAERNTGFALRYTTLKFRDELCEFEWMKFVEHENLYTQLDLDKFEEKALADGFEGVMLRDPKGKYKMGRSTENEGILLKVKRFEQSEAIVVDIEEEMHNANDKSLERAGKASRSSHKAGMVGKKTMGALVCRKDGIEFKIGTGFSAALRQKIWNEWIGGVTLRDELVTFKHQASGAKEAPRFPVFVGFRHRNDMSA